MELWRISNFSVLDGEGGRLASGRWNTAGHPVVYLAASPPGALVEIVVHLELDEQDREDLPVTYSLLQIAAPNRLRVPLLSLPVHEGWTYDLNLTRSLGDAWLKSRRSALARVPSAILPETFNYLMNPLHPSASLITVAAIHQATLDSRLLR